jgi:DNA gyrase subunit B
MMIRELIENSVDQQLAGQATTIWVETTDPTWITVEDDGPGLPFELPALSGDISRAEHLLTTMHFGPSADDHAPHIHIGGMQGVGIMVVNALSATFIVESWRHGQLWRQEYSEGVPTGSPQPVESNKEGRGTKISFAPDMNVLDTNKPEPEQLRVLCQDLTWLVGGLKIICDGALHYYPDGLRSLALAELGPLPPAPWGSPPIFWHKHEDEELMLEVVAIGQAADHEQTQWRAWANGSLSIEHGSHVEGAQLAFDRAGLKPAHAYIHIISKEPRWANPTKDRLNMPHIVERIAQILEQAL